MSQIPMMHPVSAETVQRYALNSGVLARDIDFSKITDAATFVAEVTAEAFFPNLLGATSGSTEINENRETWEPEHNSLRVPHKDGVFFATAKPTIKATLVELTPANIKLASGAADIEGDGTNFVKIKPRAQYNEGDYVGTLTWFTNYGNKGIIGAVLHNALCKTGLKWSVEDQKVGTCEVEFAGHADGAVFDDSLPIEYFVALNGTAAEE